MISIRGSLNNREGGPAWTMSQCATGPAGHFIIVKQLHSVNDLDQVSRRHWPRSGALIANLRGPTVSHHHDQKLSILRHYYSNAMLRCGYVSYHGRLIIACSLIGGTNELELPGYPSTVYVGVGRTEMIGRAGISKKNPLPRPRITKRAAFQICGQIGSL
jgi:hypothetical protein